MPNRTTTHRRILRAGLAVATTALALAAACDAGSGDDRAAEQDRATTTTVPWADEVVPSPDGRRDPLTVGDMIDELTYSSTSEMRARRDRLAVACMADRGFTLVLGKMTPYVPTGWEALDRRDFAATWGFGLAVPFGRSETTPPREQPRHADFDAHGVPSVEGDLGRSLAGTDGDYQGFSDALYKDGDRPSCQTQANAELHLLETGPFYAANELREKAVAALGADAELDRLSSEYDACMERAGFPGLASPTVAYHSIQDALLDLGKQVAPTGGAGIDPGKVTPQVTADLGTVQARELSMAAANLDCEAAFTPAARRRSDEIQRKVIAGNAPLVAAIKAN